MKAIAYSSPFVPRNGLRPTAAAALAAAAGGGEPAAASLRGICPYAGALMDAAHRAGIDAAALVLTTVCDQMRYAAALLDDARRLPGLSAERAFHVADGRGAATLSRRTAPAGPVPGGAGRTARRRAGARCWLRSRTAMLRTHEARGAMRKIARAGEFDSRLAAPNSARLGRHPAGRSRRPAAGIRRRVVRPGGAGRRPRGARRHGRRRADVAPAVRSGAARVRPAARVGRRLFRRHSRRLSPAQQPALRVAGPRIGRAARARDHLSALSLVRSLARRVAAIETVEPRCRCWKSTSAPTTPAPPTACRGESKPFWKCSSERPAPTRSPSPSGTSGTPSCAPAGCASPTTADRCAGTSRTATCGC